MAATNQRFSFKQLMELQACSACRACVQVCPAVGASGDGHLSGLYRLSWQRRALQGRGGWLERLWSRKRYGPEHWKQFSQTVYRCTLCGRCQEVCPIGIELREMWLALRQDLADRRAYPQRIDTIISNLKNSRNVFDEDNQERSEWVEDMKQPPPHGFIKKKAQVVYFTGCVASFFPLAQQIPLALAEILQAAGVDFTLLGPQEQCCGFPLLGTGHLSKARDLIEANVTAVKAKGAKEIIFACPSCYMMWKEHYPPVGRLSHVTSFLERLLSRGRLPLKTLQLRLTYHDPCDLGRQAGEYEAPRRVIQSISGVELVEMELNKDRCTCCGGGGNLEMIDQKLSADIAADKIRQAQSTGAEVVVTACQQCVRTMASFTRRNQVPLKVMDICQLVSLALDGK